MGRAVWHFSRFETERTVSCDAGDQRKSDYTR